MPSSSARCSQLPRAVDKVPFYAALKKFRDHLVGKLPDLDDSEITFPDLELKTAKKEPKEENPEQYPGENQGAEGDPALQQLLEGAYNIVPHQHPNTYQDSQGNSDSSQSLPQIKQEPVETSPQMQQQQPPPMQQQQPPQMQQQQPPQMKQQQPPQMQQQQPMVTVKQEPGVDPPNSCPSQSNSNIHKQDYYQGPGNFSLLQNDFSAMNGGSNALSGINGLFAKFSSQGNYGVVKQTSSSGEKPVQFNDALCDILTEGSSFEFTPEPVMETKAPDTSQTGKKSKPRKRKSASSLDQSPLGQNSQSPPSHPVSQPNYATLSSAMPVCQPIPMYTHPAYTQGNPINHSSAMMGMPPFTQSHTGLHPYTSQSQTTQPDMGFHPSSATKPQVTQQSSFTQMMNVNPPYSIPNNLYNNYMPHQAPNMQGYPPFPMQYQHQSQQGSYHDPQGHYQQGNYQGHPLPHEVSVKQEKPDD